MAEFIGIGTQTVAPNRSAILTESAVRSKNNSILHRDGSGILALRGITNQCRAVFVAKYTANIAVSEGGTVGPISVALALDGEILPSTNAIVTPAAAETFFNVSGIEEIAIPGNCCGNLTLVNTSDQNIDMNFPKIIVDRKS